MKYLLAILLLFLVSCNKDVIVSPSENLTGVPVMNIYAEPESLSKLRANKILNTEIPVEVHFEDYVYTATLRSAGSGSKYHPRWGFKVSLQHGAIDGLKTFNLSSQVYDRTGMNTLLAIKLYEAVGLKTHSARSVFIRINDHDEGLYPMIERIDSAFFDKRGHKYSELYKLSFDTKFSLAGGFIPEYVIDKEIPKDDNYSSLYQLFHALDEAYSDSTKLAILKNHLDVENYLKYHALTSLLNNYDAFTNNFLLLKSNYDAPFEVIPWDFDKCFSLDANVGAFGDNEIIRTLFKYKEYRVIYKSLVNQIANLYFNENFLFPIIDNYATQIKDAYKLDPYLGKEGRYIFDNEMSQLKNFITNRYNEIKAELNSF
ncbi:MAG: inner spore coat protein H [Melioribacteraceae bacterium]|nr:MAG: inner spore coat protein H [Melioribacteraceae bacterium]